MQEVPINPVTIVGGVILLIIALALIKRGLRLLGSLIVIAVLLFLAYIVLVVMGVFPDPRTLQGAVLPAGSL